MQTGWNPNFSRPVLARIPVKVPTEEQVNRFYMFFYSMGRWFCLNRSDPDYRHIQPHKGEQENLPIRGEEENHRSKGVLRRTHRCLYALYEGMRYVRTLA